MEIVLLENIKNLGNIGDLVKVKRGYGRNFLIKYGKALKASKTNIDFVKKKKTELNEKNISLKKNARKIYDLINKKSYKFLKRAKDNNELYGCDGIGALFEYDFVNNTTEIILDKE